MTSYRNHYGAMCNFSCSIGYRMNGSSTLTCSASRNKPPGFWDNLQPTCQAIRCAALPTPPNGLKTGCSDPSSELYGAICSFSCKVGYNLTGSSKRQCLENENWSGIDTSCQVINCTALVPPPNGVISPSPCLSRSTYGQSCNFSCQRQGYSLEGSSVRVCGSDGEWTGTNDTICRDIAPPNIQCPQSILVRTDPGQAYATTTWNVPVPTDNSNETLNVRGVKSPQKFNVGYTSIRYDVTDSAGLSSSYVFSIEVRDVEAPVIDLCPRDIKIISKEKVPKLILPGVKVTDNVGVDHFVTSIKNGSKVTVGQHLITYTATDKAGNKAYCRFRMTITDSPCKDLPAPKNGGKACGLAQKQMICTVHCNPGYDFTNLPARIYRCDSSGKWFIRLVRGGIKLLINPTLPDCSKAHVPEHILFNGRYHYLTNNCNKELTQVIVAKFMALLLRSFWSPGICRTIPDCQNIKVDVNCGEETRRRRDTAALLPLSVNFALKVPLSNYSSNASLDVNETSLQISNDILTALEPAASLNITGVVIVVDTTRPPEIQLTSFICDDGQVLIGTKCVNCPVGYFFNSSSCQACAVDEYQDQEAQTSCIPCPSRTSTFGQQGSKQRYDCQDLPIPTSDNGQHGMPKIKLISIILGAALVVLLIVLGIWGARKYCRRGLTMDRDLVGFSNAEYDNTVEWEELKLKSSNA